MNFSGIIRLRQLLAILENYTEHKIDSKFWTTSDTAGLTLRRFIMLVL